MVSKANIHLLIFLVTTLDTSVHNLSYSAAATTAPEWFLELNLQYLRCKVFIYFSISPQIHFSNPYTVHSFGFCNSFSNFLRRASIASVFVTIFSWQALTVFKEACATAGYLNLCSLRPLGLHFHSSWNQSNQSWQCRDFESPYNGNPSLKFHLIAGLVPRTSSSLAAGDLQFCLWLTIGSSFLDAQLACFEPTSLVYFSWYSNMSNSVQLQ